MFKKPAGPEKRPRNHADLPSARGDTKRAAVAVALTGGVAQPPRVIGYRRTGANVDVTVKVESRCFQTHSKVLAASSEYFAKHATYSATVELPTPSAPAFEALLEFFYKLCIKVELFPANSLIPGGSTLR